MKLDKEIRIIYIERVIYTKNGRGNNMATINCPNCGKEISDSCKSCKYCGFEKISSYLLNIEREKNKIKRQQEINMREERDRQINETIQQKEKNIPKCPICGSTNLSKLSSLGKATKVGLFGIFGAGDLGKTYKCNNCGSKF